MTLDDLLAKWLGKPQAGERAEYQQFLTEFCQALGLPTPGDPGHALEDYRFEAPVRSEAVFGSRSTKRIDLYKRGCFVLEAKQSQLGPGEAPPAEPAPPPPAPVYDLFGTPIGVEPAVGKPAPRYDRLMADARIQAERYALALPEAHRAPPFLIVADIGRAFELYFDWSGNGRGYSFFPDRQGYRIALEDLASERPLAGTGITARALLAAIWTDPQSVDPRLRAAKVTRAVAHRLSRVAEHLEQTKRGQAAGADDHAVALGIEQTSLFVMRLLFCMFAEDVALLPAGKFTQLLKDAREELRADPVNGRHFWRSGLDELWRMMADPSPVRPYWTLGRSLIRYFNGNLFADRTVYDLEFEFVGQLVIAAETSWKEVEPAIFGTLLEQVLTRADRARLGAHYTPRAYVERLVNATMMDVLRPEWEAVRERVRAAENPPRHGEGDRDAQRRGGGGAPQRLHDIAPPSPPPDGGDPPPRPAEELRQFHERLVALRILDPACGTGNFLYVAMEALLRLEAEAIQLAAELGIRLEPRVHPNQFLGLELNPRAAVIAELVLWIGWLRHRLANQPDAIGEPVLPPLVNINGGTHGGYDAVVARDATGAPDAGRPRRPDWPEADFIVGNPPFIGGKDIRDRLGGDYAEALWAANPRVPRSADLVMHWWDRAAEILTRPGTRLRRFGLVTTNSITQVFSRRVIEAWLTNPLPPGEGGERSEPGEGDAGPRAASPSPSHATASRGPRPLPAGEGKLSLVLAIPDHPWTLAPDAAAVRIAMTVAEAGAHDGRLIEIVSESGLATDEPALGVRIETGRINADLSIGTDVTALAPLRANAGLCSRGVQLMGAGFIVTPAQAKALKLDERPGLAAHIRPYLNGRDLLQRPRGALVIDLFGLGENDVMDRFPEVYQHLLAKVRDSVDAAGRPNGRAVNRRETYKKSWWVFGEPRSEWRAAMAGLSRYIVTTETSKHRIFQFLDASILPDNMIVAIASEDAFHLGVLQSSISVRWSLLQGATLEDRPRYSKTRCFDPFPFPDATPAQRGRIADLAERLDQTRRAALAEDDRLTVTGLYNLVAAARAGTLAPDDERRAVRARARIVAKLHDDLDAAVADAYGWAADWARAPLPPTEIVARLATLNTARAAEEKAGEVRWLRPDYQQARFGS